MKLDTIRNPASRSNPICPICGEITRIFTEKLGGFRLYYCQTCDLRFAWDAFNVDVDYDAIHEEGYYQSQSSGNEIRHSIFLSKFKPKDKEQRLMDIGCGNGHFVRKASSHGWYSTGIDVSEKAISLAKKKGIDNCVHGSIEEVSERFDPFDVITAFEVLEHVSKPIDFLNSIRGVLKPDGVLFCTVPTWDYPKARETKRLDWLPPVHLLFFTITSLIALLRKAGFLVQCIGHIPPGFWYPPKTLSKRIRWEISRLLGHSGYPHGIWAVGTPLHY